MKGAATAAATSWRGRSAELGAARLAARIAGFRAEFLYWGYFKAKPWRNWAHTHSSFEVCYAYAGRGTFTVDGEPLSVGAGDVFVARPGVVHEIVSCEEDPLGIYFWSHSLFADASVPDQSDGRALLSAFEAGSARNVGRDDGTIASLLDLLDREALLADCAVSASAAALAGALLIATARITVDRPEAGDRMDLLPTNDSASAHEMAMARAVIRYLQDNYRRQVSVRDVAAQLCLSERHTSRIFQRATGTSIHAYLQQLRLEFAAQRLVEQRIPVKKIANDCGYPDVRHFTTVFRRRWGTTPARFRQQNGTLFVES